MGLARQDLWSEAATTPGMWILCQAWSVWGMGVITMGAFYWGLRCVPSGVMCSGELP